MATTPNISLTLPTVGADNNNWGSDLNSDLSAIDALWANIGNVAFGTAATKSTGTSGATVPMLNGTNTWSGAQTLSGGLTGNVTGNVSGSSGSCTGNAATATTAASCSGNAASATVAGSCSGNAASASTAANVLFTSGVGIDWDGTKIRFIIGGAVVAHVSASAGLTNDV